MLALKVLMHNNTHLNLDSKASLNWETGLLDWVLRLELEGFRFEPYYVLGRA